MSGLDIFCTSQAAATAGSLTMKEDPSSSSSSTIHLGGSRAIDRHNPMIKDSRRLGTTITITPPNCFPHPPTTPKASRKNNSWSRPNDQTAKTSSKSSFDHHHKQKKKKKKEKSSSTDHKAGDHLISCAPGDSSRYLLGEGTAFLDVFPHFDPVVALVPNSDPTKSQAVKPDMPFPPNPPTSPTSHNQVVVLRVSLHCKGCEGKLRKHISRMQGVTSFNIDFAAKKVTVVGHVTPLGVLTSISKVKKNAQLWTPSMSPSVPREPAPITMRCRSKQLSS